MLDKGPALLAALLMVSTSVVAQDAFPGGRFEGRIQVRGASGGYSISRSTVNGVTTVNAKEKDRTVKIVEDPDKGITVESTKTYDRSNHSELKESNPAIYRYIDNSPQGMGPQKINVKVELTQVYQAQNVDELKDKHPEAHKIYERYSQGGGGIRLEIKGFEGGFPGGAFPADELPFKGEFPFKLEGIEIKPAPANKKPQAGGVDPSDLLPKKPQQEQPRGVET